MFVGSFWRQRQNEIQPPLDPCLESRLCAVTGRTNVNEAFHRPPSKIHGPCVWLRQRVRVPISTHAYDQVFTNNTAAHVADFTQSRELNNIFRPSVQPYMISWLRYDPTKEIARLRIPTLIAQGTTDIQASVLDAKALAGANPAATLLLVDGMNHVLKTVPNEQDKQVSSYSDPNLPVAADLITAISGFVNQAEEQRP